MKKIIFLIIGLVFLFSVNAEFTNEEKFLMGKRSIGVEIDHENDYTPFSYKSLKKTEGEICLNKVRKMGFYEYVNFIRLNYLTLSKIKQKEKHDVVLDSCFVLFESSLVFDNGYFYKSIKRYFASELAAKDIKLGKKGICGLEKMSSYEFFNKYGFPASRIKDLNHFKLYITLQQNQCLLYDLARVQRLKAYDDFIDTVLSNSIRYGVDYGR